MNSKAVSSTKIAGAIFAAVLLFPGVARAGVLDVFDTAVDALSAGFDYVWPDDLPKEDFTLRLGVGVGTTPDYVGSDEYRLRVIPLIDLRYKDILALQGNKLRLNFLRHKNVKAGPLMNLKLGREEKRNPVLSGLGDIADTLLAGAFIEGRYKGLFVSAEFRQALWGGQGTSARFVLAQGLYQSRGKKMTLIAAFRTGWNSRRANQTNFGITPEQSLDSGLAIYAPGSGFTKLEFDLLGRHQIGERWRLDWIAGYAQLIGDATRSPLIATHGTTDQFIVGAGLRYSF